MKRKGLISVLAVSTLGLLSVGVATLNEVSTASAQDQAVSQIAWMEDGGSVRFGSAGNGLRFTMQIRASAFDENATYGILIAPEDGYDLTEEKVFGEKAIYNWAEKDENGNWKEYVPEEGKTQIVNLVTEGFNDDTVKIDGEEVAVKEFYGSLVNLDEGNFAREFRAVGYIRTGTEGNYDYTLVGDSDNVRSMAYVAQLAIEDKSDKAPTQSQKDDLQKTYLDKVADVASSYTQEYYLEQADGSYKVEKEVLSTYNGLETKIGDSVEFVEKQFVGARFDAENENNVLEGTVYANGHLVLKAYYTYFDENIKWTNTYEADDIILKGATEIKVGLTPSIAVNPAGQTGNYYQIDSNRTEEWFVAFAPVYDKAYYAEFTGKNLQLKFDFYVDTADGTNGNMAFCEPSQKQYTPKVWHTATISLDTLMNVWDTVFDAENSGDWNKTIVRAKVNTGAEATFYFGNFRFEIAVDGAVTDTTERLIDMNGVNLYDMNNVLSLAGVAESVYANQTVVWSLTPVNGGDTITLSGNATLDKVEKRAYKAVARISAYGLLSSTIYTGVVDFYDSTETVVWNSDISLSDFIYKAVGTGLKTTPTTSLVTDAPNREGSYLQITTADMIVLLPQHTKSYYALIGGESVLKFDMYMATEDGTTSYTPIYWANENGSFSDYRIQKKQNTWNTLSISISLLVEYWDYVVLTKGTDTDGKYNGSYASRCGMVGGIGTTDSTTGAVTRTGYIGNFRIE